MAARFLEINVMCRVYINADPILYESRTRSLRIHGVITTVRLENLFWDVLHEIAGRENLTTSQFAVKLYDELISVRRSADQLRVVSARVLFALSVDARGEAGGRRRGGGRGGPACAESGLVRRIPH